MGLATCLVCIGHTCIDPQLWWNWTEISTAFWRIDVVVSLFFYSYYHVKYSTYTCRLAFSFDSFSIISQQYSRNCLSVYGGPSNCQPNFWKYKNEKEATTQSAKWGNQLTLFSMKRFRRRCCCCCCCWLPWPHREKCKTFFVCVPHDSFSVLCFFIPFFFPFSCVCHVWPYLRDMERGLSLIFLISIPACLLIKQPRSYWIDKVNAAAEKEKKWWKMEFQVCPFFLLLHITKWLDGHYYYNAHRYYYYYYVLRVCPDGLDQPKKSPPQKKQWEENVEAVIWHLSIPSISRM